MSLEAKIEALTEVMTRVCANQEEILKMARKGSDKQEEPEAEAPRSRRRAAEEAPAEEEAPRRRRAAAEDEKPAEEAPRSRRRAAAEDEKPAEEAPRRRRGAAADKEEKEAPKWKRPPEGKVKLDDIRACFAEFLNTKDKKLEEKRREHIEDILDFLKVEKTAEIDPRDFDDVLDWIEKHIDGKFKGFPED